MLQASETCRARWNLVGVRRSALGATVQLMPGQIRRRRTDVLFDFHQQRFMAPNSLRRLAQQVQADLYKPSEEAQLNAAFIASGTWPSSLMCFLRSATLCKGPPSCPA